MQRRRSSSKRRLKSVRALCLCTSSDPLPLVVRLTLDGGFVEEGNKRPPPTVRALALLQLFMLYLCVENKTGECVLSLFFLVGYHGLGFVLSVFVLMCAILAASTNEWMQVVHVATPSGIFRAGYGIWGLYATNRVSDLSGSGFYLWPAKSTWNSFCRANFFPEEDCRTDDAVEFCDGLEAVCGADMDFMQALVIIILLLSSGWCSLLLFGSRRHRVGVLSAAAGLCGLLVVLCIVAIVEWMHILNAFGDIPIRMLRSLSSSSQQSMQHAAQSVCARFTQTCYSFGYGYPFLFASALGSFMAVPVFIHAVYRVSKTNIGVGSIEPDAFIDSKNNC